MRRRLPASLATAAVVFVCIPDIVHAQRRAAPACAAEIGRIAAMRLVEECRESQPATPAMCRPQSSCETMRELIAEACREPGSEDRAACRDLADEDDDDDE